MKSFPSDEVIDQLIKEMEIDAGKIRIIADSCEYGSEIRKRAIELSDMMQENIRRVGYLFVLRNDIEKKNAQILEAMKQISGAI